jgi:dienelactone hydrolase
MPTKKNDFPISWQRFVSLYHKSSNENVFPFRNSDLKSKALSKIEKPILLVLGENDKYLYDYNIKSVVDAIKEDAENAEIFDYTIIKNTGHSFEGKEEELAKKIVSWAKKF